MNSLSQALTNLIHNDFVLQAFEEVGPGSVELWIFEESGRVNTTLISAEFPVSPVSISVELLDDEEPTTFSLQKIQTLAIGSPRQFVVFDTGSPVPEVSGRPSEIELSNGRVVCIPRYASRAHSWRQVL